MPQDLQQEVISMREWLAKEPHLPKDIGKVKLLILFAFRIQIKPFRTFKP